MYNILHGRLKVDISSIFFNCVEAMLQKAYFKIYMYIYIFFLYCSVHMLDPAFFLHPV